MQNNHYTRINSQITIIVVFAVILFVALITFISKETYSLPLFICISFYTIWLAINKELFSFITRPAILLFVSISTLRYFVLPIMLIAGGITRHVQNITLSGCVLYLYEEIIVCLLMKHMFSKYYRNKQIAHTEDVFLRKTNSYILYYICVLLVIFAIIRSPDILNVYNSTISLTSAYSHYKLSSVLNGPWGVIYRIGYLFFPCIITYGLYQIYKRKNSKWILFVLGIVLMMLTLGVSEGSSRNSAVVPGLAALFLIVKCFPKQKVKILVVFGTIIFIGFVLMTIAKFSYINSLVGNRSALDFNDAKDMMESYLAGPSYFSVAIKAKELYQESYSVSTWLNDLFGNWPILSGVFDPLDRTTIFFNNTFYGRMLSYDQIIPITGQGAFHFGFLLSVIPLCLAMYCAVQFDLKYYKSRDYIESYVYGYCCIRFCMALISNISIISAFIAVPFIEVILIVKLSSMIKPLGRIR